MASHYLRKYGVEGTVNFELYELDGTDLIATAASATGDINLIRDEAGAEELDADAFVDEGVVYSLVVSAAELTAKRITIYIIDQSSPKIWLDKVLIIETYGHASAQHPFDLGTAAEAMRGTNSAALASAWTSALATHLAAVIAAGPTNAQMNTAHGLLATPAQVATALTDIKLDHLVAVADNDDPVDSSIIAKLTSKGATPDWSTFVNTTDSLEALRDRGDAAWTTGAGSGGDATAANQALLIQILTGKQEIVGNQWIIYDTDGTTVLYTLNLSQDGTATEFNPDKREPV